MYENKFFDLPEIIDMLTDNRLKQVHDQIIESVEAIHFGENLKEVLADSVVYSLHGLLTDNEQLVQYFISDDYIDVEKDLYFFNHLKTFDIQLEDLSSHKEGELFNLSLLFQDKGKEVPVQVKVNMFHLITIDFRYDDV